MKKIKNKALALAMAGVLSVGFGATYTPNVVQTSYAETFDKAMGATPKKSTPISADNLNLIDDQQRLVLSDSDIKAITEEQARIHQKGEVAVKYNFYTYIYDDSVSAKDKAKEIMDNYSRKGDNVPFIFVLNKHDGSYYFVEDTQLAPYVSSAYVSDLAEKLFAGGGDKVNTNSVKEFIIRADSTIQMSVDGDFAFTGQMPINEKSTKDHMEIQTFNDTAMNGKHTEQTQKDDKKSTTEEYSGMIPALLSFLLAAGTIAFFVKKKRRK